MLIINFLEFLTKDYIFECLISRILYFLKINISLFNSRDFYNVEIVITRRLILIYINSAYL